MRPLDPFGVIHMHNQVHVVGSDVESVYRHLVALHGLAQPFTIRVPVPRKLQQEPAVMTPVCQVEGVAFPQVS